MCFLVLEHWIRVVCLSETRRLRRVSPPLMARLGLVVYLSAASSTAACRQAFCPTERLRAFPRKPGQQARQSSA